ncbi:S41 family peptidase [Ruminococcus flavefaciens]|uniref:S41 family peptidase n=1 Tax=Ruminococcus flavefaciens TaxID=1265 RepID=UPI0026EBEE76|nr:S41 family peptidase [Ruminococcus flavefaciens]
MKIDFTKITYGFFGACAVAGLTYLGLAKYYEKEIAFGENYGEVIQAIDDIDNVYYQEPDKSEYSRNMIAGLVNGLNDRFTFCLDRNMETENSVNKSAQLLDAGFYIVRDTNSENILISNVEPSSPAEKMGLCRGDLILKIDGVSVAKVGYYNIIEKLIGKSGTSVELLVEHDGKRNIVNYVREKDFDKARNQTSELCDNGIFCYQFDKFDVDTVIQFVSEFNSLLNEKEIKGLIIDLRQNEGGDIEEAIKFFDLFAPAGNQVLTQESRSGKICTFQTTDEIKYKDIKVAVLVSNDTYSSGEILASLFKDTGLGVVIGTQTGGKGVFQVRKRFNDFYDYSIVAGYYYVNDLPNYNGVGITPDIVVDMDQRFIGTDEDTQLQKALELLS